MVVGVRDRRIVVGMIGRAWVGDGLAAKEYLSVEQLRFLAGDIESFLRSKGILCEVKVLP